MCVHASATFVWRIEGYVQLIRFRILTSRQPCLAHMFILTTRWNWNTKYSAHSLLTESLSHHPKEQCCVWWGWEHSWWRGRGRSLSTSWYRRCVRLVVCTWHVLVTCGCVPLSLTLCSVYTLVGVYLCMYVCMYVCVWVALYDWSVGVRAMWSLCTQLVLITRHLKPREIGIHCGTLRQSWHRKINYSSAPWCTQHPVGVRQAPVQVARYCSLHFDRHGSGLCWLARSPRSAESACGVLVVLR